MPGRSREESLERLAERIAAILGAAGGPLTVRAVGRLAKARRQDVRYALQLLHDRGQATWRPGPYGAHLWRLVGDAG